MNTKRRIMMVIMIAVFFLCTGFVYGFVVGKTGIFPYPLIKNIYYALFPEDDSVEVTWLTQTSLFPVRMTIHDWPMDVQPYSRGGGSITTLGNRVLGVDKNGEFFIYDQKNGIWTLGKSINTNIGDLARKGNDPREPEMDVLRSFRFMGIAAKLMGEETHLFVIYHYWHLGRECKTTRVSRFISADFDQLLIDKKSMKDEDWQLIYESQPCLEFSYRNASPFQSPNTGGRLVLDDQNNLFVSLGDHHLDGVNNPEIAAQDDELDYGKIIRIDLETLQAKTYAYGIRNPQGMAIDAQGNLWETEHGPRGGDELNLIKAGANYGWPLTTFGTQYRRSKWKLNETQGRHEGYELPVYAWVPSIGISNLVRIKDQPALWRGDFLISALRTGSLYRVRLREGRMLFSEPIQVGERIRDLTLMADGSIVLWTDNRNIIHVVPELGESGSERSRANRLTATGVPEALHDTVSNCMSCHSFSKNISSETAPSLWSVFGRSIGSTNYPDYSNVLRNKSHKTWDSESLKAFIRNPQEFAPGSTMPATNTGDAQNLDALVDYLRTLH